MSDSMTVLDLEDGAHSVRFLSYGARLQRWLAPHEGRQINVVVGHEEARTYLDDSAYLGAIVGRVANRISNGRLVLDGRSYTLDRNEGPHMLHGGSVGLAHLFWQIEPDGPRAGRMSLVSEDGDMGFPGRVEIDIHVSLHHARLTYDMTVRSDRPTPINLAQHAYWNLSETGDVLDHSVDVAAQRYTPTGPDLVPTGKIAPLSPALQNLKRQQPLRQAAPDGLDVNFVLDTGEARVVAPNGLCLTVATDQPCLQLYTGQMLPSPFRKFAGLCLEPQGYVDALNQGFPPSLATPDAPYRQISSFWVGPQAE